MIYVWDVQYGDARRFWVVTRARPRSLISYAWHVERKKFPTRRVMLMLVPYAST